MHTETKLSQEIVAQLSGVQKMIYSVGVGELEKKFTEKTGKGAFENADTRAEFDAFLLDMAPVYAEFG